MLFYSEICPYCNCVWKMGCKKLSRLNSKLNSLCHQCYEKMNDGLGLNSLTHFSSLNGLCNFIICRCWERNINMGYWWIIRSPILFAYLVRDSHTDLRPVIIHSTAQYRSSVNNAQWSHIIFCFKCFHWFYCDGLSMWFQLYHQSVVGIFFFF